MGAMLRSKLYELKKETSLQNNFLILRKKNEKMIISQLYNSEEELLSDAKIIKERIGQTLRHVGHGATYHE